MVRKIVKLVILVPLALIIVVFAVANRAPVTISLDPFSPVTPALAFSLPLFVVVLVVLIAGVIVGGAAAWLRQAKWRRRARRHGAEVRALRVEAEALKRGAETEPPPSASIAAIAYRHPPAA